MPKRKAELALTPTATLTPTPTLTPTATLSPTPTATPTPHTGDILLTVFRDSNEDGHYNAGDAPLPDLIVTLRDARGNARSVALTDAQGQIYFRSFDPGQYSLWLFPPAGTVSTTPLPAIVQLQANSSAQIEIGLIPAIRDHYWPLILQP